MRVYSRFASGVVSDLVSPRGTRVAKDTDVGKGVPVPYRDRVHVPTLKDIAVGAQAGVHVDSGEGSRQTFPVRHRESLVNVTPEWAALVKTGISVFHERWGKLGKHHVAIWVIVKMEVLPAHPIIPFGCNDGSVIVIRARRRGLREEDTSYRLVKAYRIQLEGPEWGRTLEHCRIFEAFR
jgi:hypothetical protein